MLRSLMAACWVLTLASPMAHAHEEGYGYETIQYVDELPDPSTPMVRDGRRLQKFETILQTLGIPPEAEPDVLKTLPKAGEASEEVFLQMLRFIDPAGALKRYLDLGPTTIDLYRDFFSHLLPQQYLEYRVEARESGESFDSRELLSEINGLRDQVQQGQNLPLTGLRIAIDPGHMGDDFWDSQTGKFISIQRRVRDRNGRVRTVNLGRVSEGQLTLWTALLAANELRALGAEVMLTRAQLGPVSSLDHQTFDWIPLRNRYFHESFDGWMTGLYQISDSELRQRLSRYEEVQKMFPRSAEEELKLRRELFHKTEDLDARVRKIDQFNPHLTLDIHFDAFDSSALQDRTNDVEGYVPGFFASSETGSRKNRALALKHALEARRWNESVELTAALTGAIAKNTGLPLLDKPAMMDGKGNAIAVKVKDGVYARNLSITRNNTRGIVAYLECLHYDFQKGSVSEFKNMLKRDRTGSFQGKTFQYPSRLDPIVKGIREGVLNYLGMTQGVNPETLLEIRR